MSEQQRWAVMCSMTGGWGVARPEHAYREDGLLACTEWEYPHDTWEEAMRYADTQARTVTVTLPANPDVVLPAMRIMTSRAPEGVWTERAYRVAEYQEITIPDAHREPLALALLAHARRKDRN